MHAATMGTHSYYKIFGCFNRKFKVNQTAPPPDVREAFWRYTGGSDHMTATQFRNFMVEHQKEEGCTAVDVESIMQSVFYRRHHDRRHRFTLDDFFHFIFRDDLNGPINPKVHHEMSEPLQHYYIYTGHNSYLTGNQINSNCSEIPIIQSLENGVRGIELDLWPNSTKDNVHVLHGRTLTTPVPLMKCLQSIKEHAFVKSPYPVIITLEDHLTRELQDKVAEMVTQVFGDMLYCPESGCMEEFPSPEALKHKILLSTKPLKEYLETNNKDGEHSSPKEKNSSDDESKHENEAEADDNKSDSDEESDHLSKKPGSPTQYKRLIAIRAGNFKKKSSKDVGRILSSNTITAIRLSLSEHELEKATSSHSTDVIRFTRKNILRVYPKGTRVTSSNFKPINGWIHGAQMVAFNMQGYGKPLWIMQGMFRSNGGCGYVKKPDILIRNKQNNGVFDPKLSRLVRKTLKVIVYMGDGWRLDFSHTHFDKFSPPDFYTKIFVLGVPADNAKMKTKVIEDNWAPYWDQEFKFPLRIPELAQLRIEVREHDRSDKDDFGGQTCLPVSELRPGIRAVPLYDRRGRKFKSVRLLMRFEFE